MIKYKFNDEIVDINKTLLESLEEDDDKESLDESGTGLGRNSFAGGRAQQTRWIGIRGDNQLPEYDEIANAYAVLQHIEDGEELWSDNLNGAKFPMKEANAFALDRKKFQDRYERDVERVRNAVSNLKNIKEEQEALQKEMEDNPGGDYGNKAERLRLAKKRQQENLEKIKRDAKLYCEQFKNKHFDLINLLKPTTSVGIDVSNHAMHYTPYDNPDADYVGDVITAYDNYTGSLYDEMDGYSGRVKIDKEPEQKRKTYHTLYDTPENVKNRLEADRAINKNKTDGMYLPVKQEFEVGERVDAVGKGKGEVISVKPAGKNGQDRYITIKFDNDSEIAKEVADKVLADIDSLEDGEEHTEKAMEIKKRLDELDNPIVKTYLQSILERKGLKKE